MKSCQQNFKKVNRRLFRAGLKSIDYYLTRHRTCKKATRLLKDTLFLGILFAQNINFNFTRRVMTNYNLNTHQPAQMPARKKIFLTFFETNCMPRIGPILEDR